MTDCSYHQSPEKHDSCEEHPRRKSLQDEVRDGLCTSVGNEEYDQRDIVIEAFDVEIILETGQSRIPDIGLTCMLLQ
jgi:hypothetical protein